MSSDKGRKRRKKAIDGYTEEQKRLVIEKYPYCKTNQAKRELMSELGMTKLSQLYNLANRVGATKRRGQDPVRHRVEEAMDPARRLERETPRTKKFTAEEDAYITDYFGKMHIEEIAYHLDHTETAILYRARKLGVRRYCKYWDVTHIVDWLSQSREVLINMGVDVYPCYSREGVLEITLVSSSSLARVIADEQLRSLLEAGGADYYFIREILDIIEDHMNDIVKWEASRWVSHGHICLNPWAGESFGLFDDGSDHKMYGRELYPSDLTRPYPGGGRWEIVT